MSYRNKTYIIFNADYPNGNGDIHYYRLMQAWKQKEHIDFNFHDAHDLNNLWNGSNEDTIKRRLRERMANSKQVIVLVGEHTKNLYKFVRWEIQVAIDMDIPIIAVNLDKANKSTNRTPPILKENAYFVNIPFEMLKIKYTLDNFPAEYHREKKNAPSDRNYSDWSNRI